MEITSSSASIVEYFNNRCPISKGNKRHSVYKITIVKEWGKTYRKRARDEQETRLDWNESIVWSLHFSLNPFYMLSKQLLSIAILRFFLMTCGAAVKRRWPQPKWPRRPCKEGHGKKNGISWWIQSLVKQVWLNMILDLWQSRHRPKDYPHIYYWSFTVFKTNPIYYVGDLFQKNVGWSSSKTWPDLFLNIF